MIYTAKNKFIIIIDCNPSLGMITINALTASDSVLTPVQASYLPVKGLQQLIQQMVLDYITEHKVVMTKVQSERIKEYAAQGKLTPFAVRYILLGISDHKNTPIRITRSKLEEFFEDGESDQEIEEVIITLSYIICSLSYHAEDGVTTGRLLWARFYLDYNLQKV